LSKQEIPQKPAANIDWFIFGAGSLLLLVVVSLILTFPEDSSTFIEQLYETVTVRIGVVYVIAAIAILVFLLWLALGPFGNTVLGMERKPSYSRFSWASMLFCAGIGASLIYWGATEWTFYYVDPPFGIEARSDAAILWASSYGIFHWGPIGWAFYCLPAVALGVSYHCRRIPSLRLSAACQPVIGKWSGRWPGRLIDLFFIIGVLATCATGLGFGTSVVASSINRLTGLEDNIFLQASIVATATLLMAFSVYRGLDKGIRVLSVVNACLALFMITFILLIGPTGFILEMGVASLGKVVFGFVEMMTWSDPLQRSDFVESWTVFYWAWWLAMGPFIGMFVCKISEGRTIRELIFGMLGWGSLGCALFFIVLGNYALFLELAGQFPVVTTAVDQSPSAAVAGIISLLPLGAFWLIYLIVIGLVFMATTYDSAAYTIAAGATRELDEHQHPDRWHRVFWAAALGLLPVSLLFAGGLRELQTASLVASLPLLLIYIVLARSTILSLKSQVKPSSSGGQ